MLAAPLLVIAVSPAPAFAGAACNIGAAHCYLRGWWNTNGTVYGSSGQLESDCLFVSDWTAQNKYPASNEAWVNTTAPGGPPTWIETGIGYGGNIGNSLALFMAMSFPSGSGTEYYESDGNQAAHTGVTYTYSINNPNPNSNRWDTLISGTDGDYWQFTQGLNNPIGISLAAGTEFMTADDGHFHTYSRGMNLTFNDGNNVTHAGWANASGAMYASATPSYLMSIAVSSDHRAETATHHSPC